MGVNAAVDEQAVESLANVFAEVKAHLDERQRRLLLGAMARELGRGGQAALSAVTGVAKDVIGRGSASLEAGVEPDGRVREPGGGRKPVTELDPELAGALEELVDPESRGDPMKPLKWTTKSTQNLAGELTGQEHRCGPPGVKPGSIRIWWQLAEVNGVFVKIPPKYGSRRTIDIASCLWDLISAHLRATEGRECSCNRTGGTPLCEAECTSAGRATRYGSSNPPQPASAEVRSVPGKFSEAVAGVGVPPPTSAAALR